MRRRVACAMMTAGWLAAGSAMTSAGAATVPRALYKAARAKQPAVVVIDPGHGGHDPGTHAASGLKEKTVTLAIARDLYGRLKAVRGIRPVLTRDSDTYLTLRQRVRIAQKHHANLFLSIHENAYSNNPAVKGGTCYVLSQHGATDAKAAQLAHFENSADRRVAGVHFSEHNHTLNAMLTDLYQNASIENADALASHVIRQFGRVEPVYRHKPPRANFAVLRDPMIPSVLCETAFLSNPHQARELAGSAFRRRLADAIYRGILAYFKTHPPEHLQAVGGQTYVVKSGDTLSGIAAAQGVPVQAIRAINHLHSTRLSVGQKLALPASASGGDDSRAHAASMYTVQRGDTLSGIAAAHDVSIAALERVNDLRNAQLQIGQKLKVPGGS